MHSVRTLTVLLLAAAATLSCGKVAPQYQRADQTPDTRTEDLLGRIPLDEKLDMLAGASWMDTLADQKLGIPAIHMAHGTSGIADWTAPHETIHPQFNTTAFPAGIALAASWDPELATKVGQAIAREALGAGRNQLLGPALDINRTPLSGATFESYGEDPLLAAKIAVPFIRAVQAEGVIATAKHFVLHNQETKHHTANVKASEQALREIYFPAMEAAVREGAVWSVMASSGKLNGIWESDNERYLTQLLKKNWAFRGYVVSDWGGTHSVAGTVSSGIDLEMPGADTFTRYLTFLEKTPGANPGLSGGYMTNERLSADIARGSLRQDAVDEMLRRRFRAMFASGIFDAKNPAAGAPPATAQQGLARAAAAEGIVLLKNSGALPLNPGKVGSLAVIGPSAATARTGGGGPTLVIAKAPVSPLDGIKARAGSATKVEYAQGVPMEGEQGTPAIAEAAALARRSDVAIVFVGTSAALETGNSDRKSLDLPARQNELVSAVTAANRNTIVVVIAGSAVDMTSWSSAVNAIAMAWFPGEQGGNAIADVLFGDVNPAARLPLTFPRALQDTSANGFYPGTETDLEYGEGIFVGYRHFDKDNITPLFPFGHGLSYTTFEYSNLTVPAKVEPGKKIPVTLTLKNSGARAGAEVVQLYIAEAKPKTERPPKELRGFQRVTLKPGESRVLKFEIEPRALAHFDAIRHDWLTDNGVFEVQIGSSSRDIRARANLELAPPAPPPPPPPPIGSLAPKGAKPTAKAPPAVKK